MRSAFIPDKTSPKYSSILYIKFHLYTKGTNESASVLLVFAILMPLKKSEMCLNLLK